jgi:hypothetical protein
MKTLGDRHPKNQHRVFGVPASRAELRAGPSCAQDAWEGNREQVTGDRDTVENGGQGRNRTADASLFRAALYHLSYLANLDAITDWRRRTATLMNYSNHAGSIANAGSGKFLTHATLIA